MIYEPLIREVKSIFFFYIKTDICHTTLIMVPRAVCCTWKATTTFAQVCFHLECVKTV